MSTDLRVAVVLPELPTPEVKSYQTDSTMRAHPTYTYSASQMYDYARPLAAEIARLTAELQEVQEVRKDAARLDWLLPNLHPGTWGMEFEGGYEWSSDAELLRKWRAAIDAELAATPEATNGRPE